MMELLNWNWTLGLGKTLAKAMALLEQPFPPKTSNSTGKLSTNRPVFEIEMKTSVLSELTEINCAFEGKFHFFNPDPFVNPLNL